MKKNFKHFLCNSLRTLVDSLREIDDADYEWRAFLERTLIESYLDKRHIEEACSLASELSKFIQNYLPSMFEDFFEFMVRNLTILVVCYYII
jgi:hypothetical protein